MGKKAVSPISVGDVFNRLTVIDIVVKRYNPPSFGGVPRNSTFYVCKCECGNITEIRGGNKLRIKHTTSCGCYQKEAICLYRYKQRPFARAKDLHTRYATSARKRDIIFDLSLDQFKNLISSNCAYCGVPPSMLYRRNNLPTHIAEDFRYNGVDRVDNDKGYTPENSVTACAMCNRAKSSYPINEFIEWVQRLSSFMGGGGYALSLDKPITTS